MIDYNITYNNLQNIIMTSHMMTKSVLIELVNYTKEFESLQLLY